MQKEEAITKQEAKSSVRKERPRKTKIFFVCLGLIVILVGGIWTLQFVKQKKAWENSITKFHNMEIRYSYGIGTKDGSEDLTIENRKYHVQRIEDGKITADLNGSLSKQDLANLKDLVSKAPIFSFKEKYDCLSDADTVDCPTGLEQKSILFKLDDQEKVVQIDAGYLPTELDTILRKLKEIRRGIAL